VLEGDLRSVHLRYLVTANTGCSLQRLKRTFARTLAGLVLLAGMAVSDLVFLVGAPAATGAPFREPVGTMCYGPWVEAHPGDHEPAVHGTWSWWPPGITCEHASGEIFVEPSPSDAAAVAAFGVAVLTLGVVPTWLAARMLWWAGDSHRVRPTVTRPSGDRA
jgi:hypothetical protein